MKASSLLYIIVGLAVWVDIRIRWCKFWLESNFLFEV